MAEKLVCPKCGYDKYKLPHGAALGDTRLKECRKCSYVGTFISEEEYENSEKVC
jgi:hypothetical protein